VPSLEVITRSHSTEKKDVIPIQEPRLNPFIKVVSNNRVLITGSKNKKMLFIIKSGTKQGEIKLDFPATSVAVIDDKTLAVAAHLEVVFVDTKTFKRIDSIAMGDTCIRIAYVKNQLVVKQQQMWRESPVLFLRRKRGLTLTLQKNISI
jgi:hypothetical protein